MELRHLRYFAAVAEHRSFSRAAEAIHGSQPSLSQQIRQLEIELGVELFDRTNRHVELTNAGRSFLEKVREMLAELDEAVLLAREAARGERGALTIGFVGGAILSALPESIREYRRRHPNVDVTLVTVTQETQLDGLRSGRYDVVVRRAAPLPEGFEARPFHRENYVAAVPIVHALTRKAQLRYADLETNKLILLSRSSDEGLTDEILRACNENGYDPEKTIEAQNEETVIGLVASGAGVAIVPDSWQAIRIDGVAFKPLLPPGAGHTLVLCWRTDKTPPLAREFVEIASKNL